MKVAGVFSASMLHARLGRVDPLLQRLEHLLAVVVADHELAVQHVAAKRESQLGEVAAHRLAVARLHEHLVAVDEDDVRKPSHLRSNSQPSPAGSSAAARASAGASGGEIGSVKLRALRHGQANCMIEISAATT